MTTTNASEAAVEFGGPESSGARAGTPAGAVCAYPAPANLGSEGNEGRKAGKIIPFSSREWRLAEANRRLEVLEAFWALLAQGRTRKEAVKELRRVLGNGGPRGTASLPTIWRWEKGYEARGFVGLIPETDKCGRKSTLEKLGIAGEVLERVQGINLDVESTTAAWRLYARSEECPEELARVVLDPRKSSKHALPPSLRRAGSVNRNLELAHRGPRALSLGGMYTPRRMDVLPGDVFTADDTTPIWGWWVPWQESEEYPFGVKLLQGQFLPVMDVASQCVLCFVLIAREKSSYRAADIWHLFGHTFETVGLPRLGWQLERGSWEANVIRGQEVEYRDGEVSLSRRVGGLRSLPTNITEWHRKRFTENEGLVFPKTLQTWTSYLPKSKSIEALFNRSQGLEGTLWGCLGRDQMRRPFEAAKQQFAACQRGAADPREHFLSQTEMVGRLNGLLEYLNEEVMEGEVFKGIPRQLFEQARSEYPLFRLPEEQRYLYRRDWRTVQITQGWARVRFAGSEGRWSLWYCNARVFAELEGQEVVVYFDKENFEAPAQVHSARTGEFICEAEYQERRGSFLDAEGSGHELRKAWRNAVMAAYGTVVRHAPSRQAPGEVVERRGFTEGNEGNEGRRGGREAGEQVSVKGEIPRTPKGPRKVDYVKQNDFYRRQAEALKALTTNGQE